jgi:hypothetical protein
MRVDFCTFTSEDDGEVIVNPLQVLYLRTVDKGKTTRIYFGPDDYITVNGSPSEVEDGLTIQDDD